MSTSHINIELFIIRDIALWVNFVSIIDGSSVYGDVKWDTGNTGIVMVKTYTSVALLRNQAATM